MQGQKWRLGTNRSTPIKSLHIVYMEKNMEDYYIMSTAFSSIL